MDKEPKTLADKLADLLLIGIGVRCVTSMLVTLAELEMWVKQKSAWRRNAPVRNGRAVSVKKTSNRKKQIDKRNWAAV